MSFILSSRIALSFALYSNHPHFSIYLAFIFLFLFHPSAVWSLNYPLLALLDPLRLSNIMILINFLSTVIEFITAVDWSECAYRPCSLQERNILILNFFDCYEDCNTWLVLDMLLNAGTAVPLLSMRLILVGQLGWTTWLGFTLVWWNILHQLVLYILRCQFTIRS